MSYNTGPATTYYSIPTMASGDVPALDTDGLTAILNAIDSAMHSISEASGGAPSGAIMDFGGATAPTGWLLCDGSAISRSTYSQLFTAIGVTYGSGDGSTTFNVPDLRGRVAVGFAASGGNADVSTLGNNDGVAEANRRPKHNHTFTNPTVSVTNPTISISDPGHEHSCGAVTWDHSGSWGYLNFQADGDDAYGTLHTASSGTGISATASGTSASASGGAAGVGGTAALDAPAWIVVNKIIKT